MNNFISLIKEIIPQSYSLPTYHIHSSYCFNLNDSSTRLSDRGIQYSTVKAAVDRNRLMLLIHKLFYIFDKGN